MIVSTACKMETLTIMDPRVKELIGIKPSKKKKVEKMVGKSSALTVNPKGLAQRGKGEHWDVWVGARSQV